MARYIHTDLIAADSQALAALGSTVTVIAKLRNQGHNTMSQPRFCLYRSGSWLNMAECALSVLARQCLDQRLAPLHRLAC